MLVTSIFSFSHNVFHSISERRTKSDCMNVQTDPDLHSLQNTFKSMVDDVRIRDNE